MPLELVPLPGVDPRVRLLRLGDEVDLTAVVCERVVVLVDSGPTPHVAMEAVALLADALVGRDLVVVDTHADYDHAWGNQAFVGPDAMRRATVVGHRACAARLRGAVEAGDLERRAARDERFRGVRLVPPTVLVGDEGGAIDGGDLVLELLHAPGHAEDQLVVWIPAIRTLLAADAAEHPWPVAHGAASLAGIRATLERLVALDPAVVVPCHGSTTDPGLLRRNLAYLDELGRRAAAAPPGLEDGPDLDERAGFPYAEALAHLAAGPPRDEAFYRGVHRLALLSALGLPADWDAVMEADG